MAQPVPAQLLCVELYPMMWIANLVMKFFGGPVLKSLLQGYRMNLDAKNKHEVRVADLAMADLDADIQARRGAKEIRLATASYPEMRIITFCIAAPFVVHLNAVALDTTFSLGWGIPAFPSPFDEWEGIILLSFFGVHATASAVKSFSAAIMKRR